MRNYILTIIFLLDFFIIINIKKLKPLKNFGTFINIFTIVQLFFVLWIFYIDNEVIMLNFIDSIMDKFTNIFLHSHKAIPSELKP